MTDVDTLQYELDMELINIKELLFDNIDDAHQLQAAISYLQAKLEHMRHYMEVEADDNEIFSNEGC